MGRKNGEIEAFERALPVSLPRAPQLDGRLELGFLDWKLKAGLEVLSRNPVTEVFRQAAVHALSGIASQSLRRHLKPVLDALSGPIIFD